MFERYHRPTLAEILSRMQRAVLDIDGTIDVSENSVLGQILGIVADEADQAYQYAEYAAMQTFRPTASGAALDAIGALIGVNRRMASEPAQTVLVNGSVPDTFSIHGVECRVLRRMTGRFGYLKSSVRYPNSGYRNERDLPSSIDTQQPDVLLAKGATYDSVSPFPVALAGESLDAVTIVGVNISGGAPVQVGGTWIYFPRGTGVSGAPGETDDEYRQRIKLNRNQIGGTLQAIQSAISAEIAPCTVTEWPGPGDGTNGQAPGTIRVLFPVVPSASRDEIAAAIAKHRPAGIGSWAPPDGEFFRGEAWGIAASRDMAVVVSGAAALPGASVDRAAVEKVIRDYVSRHPVNTPLYTAKLAAKIVDDVPGMLAVTVEIGGLSIVPSGPQSINITGITWQ